MHAPLPEPARVTPAPGTRRVYLIETAVFLLVLTPWMGFATLGTRPQDLSFPLVAGVIVFHDLALTALALYLVWRNGEGMASIGWVRRGAGREALVGVALFVPLILLIAALGALWRGAGLSEPVRPPSYLMPRGGSDYTIALLLLLTVAVAEETVFRGYLLSRLRQVTGSTWLAVALSSALFAFGHGYQGSAGIVATGAIGVAFAVIYLRRGSLVAPAVMHFIQNFIGLIVVPRFAGG